MGGTAGIVSGGSFRATAVSLPGNRLAQQQNCYGIRWEVLDWNQPAIELYQSMGGTFLDHWRSVLLKDEALRQLADKGGEWPE